MEQKDGVVEKTGEKGRLEAAEGKAKMAKVHGRKYLKLLGKMRGQNG